MTSSFSMPLSFLRRSPEFAPEYRDCEEEELRKIRQTDVLSFEAERTEDRPPTSEPAAILSPTSANMNFLTKLILGGEQDSNFSTPPRFFAPKRTDFPPALKRKEKPLPRGLKWDNTSPSVTFTSKSRLARRIDSLADPSSLPPSAFAGFDFLLETNCYPSKDEVLEKLEILRAGLKTLWDTCHFLPGKQLMLSFMDKVLCTDDEEILTQAHACLNFHFSSTPFDPELAHMTALAISWNYFGFLSWAIKSVPLVFTSSHFSVEELFRKTQDLKEIVPEHPFHQVSELLLRKIPFLYTLERIPIGGERTARRALFPNVMPTPLETSAFLPTSRVRKLASISKAAETTSLEKVVSVTVSASATVTSSTDSFDWSDLSRVNSPALWAQAVLYNTTSLIEELRMHWEELGPKFLAWVALQAHKSPILPQPLANAILFDSDFTSKVALNGEYRTHPVWSLILMTMSKSSVQRALETLPATSPLFSAVTNSGRTIAHLAFKYGLVKEVLKLRIFTPSDLIQEDALKKTPLHYAIDCDHADGLIRLLERPTFNDCALTLLVEGHNLLHYSAKQGSLRCLQILSWIPVLMGATTPEGETAIHISKRLHPTSPATLWFEEIFLAKGHDRYSESERWL